MKKILLELALILGSLSASPLSDYETNHFCFQSAEGEEYAVIRTFTQDKNRLQLMVNTYTLLTRIQPSVKTEGHPCAPSSRYQMLLKQSIRPPYPLQNDGIVQTEHGMTVTTDLCPSSKSGFEQGLYEVLITHFPVPVPVTLFITGRWIEKHPEAFRQFRQWEKEEKLSITWGNHTYTHPYHPKIPLGQNFALSKDYDLRQDTLMLEQLLIRRGVTPSVFFRFPGLVSDPKAMQTIHDLGLITIGANTWIAKGEKPKSGAMILLHGNKNEPKGVEMFLKMLKTKEIRAVQSLPKSLYYRTN